MKCRRHRVGPRPGTRPWATTKPIRSGPRRSPRETSPVMKPESCETWDGVGPARSWGADAPERDRPANRLEPLGGVEPMLDRHLQHRAGGRWGAVDQAGSVSRCGRSRAGQSMWKVLPRGASTRS